MKKNSILILTFVPLLALLMLCTLKPAIGTELDIKQLYAKLKDKNDDTAYHAFIMLTEALPENISKANAQADLNLFNINFCLPSRSKGFLQQLSELTRYCRTYHINYKGNSELQSILASLRQKSTSYKVVYELENTLINSLNPEDITAVEYWAAIYEKNWRSAYSAGRILDRFYSEKWPLIVSDKRLLCLFLKKACLYKRLGIIGSCNLYLTKFNGANNATLTALRELEKETEDEDIKTSIRSVLSGSAMSEIETRIFVEEDRKKNWFKSGSDKWPEKLDVLPIVLNMGDSLKEISRLNIPEENREEEIRRVAELADYSQMDETLIYLKELKHVSSWNNTIFIRDFFGVPIDYGNDDPYVVDSFLSVYKQMDEVNLYQYYLEKAGIQIRNKEGDLDYKKIYNILKFDISIPFVGGTSRDFGAFAVVKILETTFHTRLGMPARHEHRYANFVKTFVDERRTLWMTYLRDHGMVTKVDPEPSSFKDYDVY